jgi:hypothetical protein
MDQGGSSMNGQLEHGWIEPQDIQFRQDAGGLMAAAWNRRECRVTASRLFPMTYPDGCVVIRDLLGQEWGVLRSISGLASESRDALERELQIRQFLPHIERISSIRRRIGQWLWDVQTDCGFTQFRTGPLYESTVVLSNGCRLVVDLSDQKYLLPDDGSLDSFSSKVLAKWL